MCLIPAEARTISKQKQNKQIESNVKFRHEGLHKSKDARLFRDTRVIEHRLQTPRKRTNNAKDTTDPMSFKNATKKIIKKLKNTRRFFNEERRVLNETKEYSDGMPSWLPTMNFVGIHFYNYRSPRRQGSTVTEKKVSKNTCYLIDIRVDSDYVYRWIMIYSSPMAFVI